MPSARTMTHSSAAMRKSSRQRAKDVPASAPLTAAKALMHHVRREHNKPFHDLRAWPRKLRLPVPSAFREAELVNAALESSTCAIGQAVWHTIGTSSKVQVYLQASPTQPLNSLRQQPSCSSWSSAVATSSSWGSSLGLQSQVEMGKSTPAPLKPLRRWYSAKAHGVAGQLPCAPVPAKAT